MTATTKLSSDARKLLSLKSIKEMTDDERKRIFDEYKTKINYHERLASAYGKESCDLIKPEVDSLIEQGEFEAARRLILMLPYSVDKVFMLDYYRQRTGQNKPKEVSDGDNN